ACGLAGLPLRIAGDGPDRDRLARQAGEGVSFLGRVSDEVLRDEYRQARVVILPGEEDFGIVPLEAQACGRPVVALARGGALETVRRGETGLLVDGLSTEAFSDAVAQAVQQKFHVGTIREQAELFGRQRFGDQMEDLVN